MDLQGKIIAAVPERSGTSARGEWKSQDFVVETHETYPKKMVFTVFGADRLQRFNIQVGQEVMVSFDINAHEYNGRWFNDIRAFDVRLVDPATIGATGAAPFTQPAAPFAQPAAPAAPFAPAAPAASAPAAAPFPPVAEGENADDLPF